MAIGGYESKLVKNLQLFNNNNLNFVHDYERMTDIPELEI
jgi:hypothetical protein